MPTDVFNNLARLAPVAAWIAGVIQQDASGIAPTLAYQSGFAESDQAQVTLARNSAGNYTLTAANFQGLNGLAVVGMLTPMTTGAAFTASYTNSYSGATATITILTFNAADAAADCSVGFEFKGI